MRLIKIYPITRIKKQVFGGGKVYLCDCGHIINIPPSKKEIKCIYCGRVK